MLSALFFYPRGGSAQVARALAGALPEAGWRMTLATGSLGGAGDPTNAAGFYSGIEVFAVDYSRTQILAPGNLYLRTTCGQYRLTVSGY